MLNSSSITCIWSLVNQAQTFFLLLLTRAYLPDDVKSVITGPSFALFPFDYIPFKRMWGFKSFLSYFDFELSNQTLDYFGIKSDSTIYNSSSFFWVLALWAIIHLFVFLLHRWLSRWTSERAQNCCTKFIKLIVTKAFVILTYHYYIRIILETMQYLLISSMNEIYHFNTNGAIRLVSLAFAFIMLAFYIALIWFVIYLVKSSYKLNETEDNNIFGEFFSGLQTSSKAMFFVVVNLIKRALLVIVLISWVVLPSWLVVGFLSIIEFLYIVYVVANRPFKEIIDNAVEIINEMYFFVFFTSLMFLNTEEKWSNTKTTIFIWTQASNNMGVFLVVLANTFVGIWRKCRKNNPNQSSSVVPRVNKTQDIKVINPYLWN